MIHLEYSKRPIKKFMYKVKMWKKIEAILILVHTIVTLFYKVQGFAFNVKNPYFYSGHVEFKSQALFLH